MHPENRWRQASKGRPSAPGSMIPQPEKNRRVCADRRQARVLQTRLERVRLPSQPLGYASRTGTAMHRRLRCTCSVREHNGVLPPPSSSRDPREGGREPVRTPLSPSAPRPRLSPFRRGRGAPTFGLASFTRSSSPSGPLRAEPLEPTTPLTVNDASEGIFLFVIK